MWTHVFPDNQADVERLASILDQGYEPFAVTPCSTSPNREVISWTYHLRLRHTATDWSPIEDQIKGIRSQYGKADVPGLPSARPDPSVKQKKG